MRMGEVREIFRGGERRVVRTWMRMRMAQRAISETTWGAENARSGSCCC